MLESSTPRYSRGLPVSCESRDRRDARRFTPERGLAVKLRVRHHAVGLNYIDVYHRSGLYPLPMPSGPLELHWKLGAASVTVGPASKR